MTPYTPDELSEAVAESKRCIAIAHEVGDREMEISVKVVSRLLATLEAQAAEIERWKCAVREVMASRNPMDEDDANRHLYASGWEDACRVVLRRVNEPQAQQEPQE